MRIKNKYLRNKHYREKHYKTIRNREHPFETYCHSPNHPWNFFNKDLEKQIEENFKWIHIKARALENGNKKGFFNAPKDFRKEIADVGKRAARKEFVRKMANWDDSAIEPIIKKDANWLWF
jgi:hypothetical protein